MAWFEVFIKDGDGLGMHLVFHIPVISGSLDLFFFIWYLVSVGPYGSRRVYF